MISAKHSTEKNFRLQKYFGSTYTNSSNIKQLEDEVSHKRKIIEVSIHYYKKALAKLIENVIVRVYEKNPRESKSNTIWPYYCVHNIDKKKLLTP